VFARIATFRGRPDRFEPERYAWVLETIAEADGFEIAYHVVDRESGDAISISVFDSVEQLQAAEAAVGDARRRLGIAASPPDEVRICEVVARTQPTRNA
jgi:hypothetical protein